MLHTLAALAIALHALAVAQPGTAAGPTAAATESGAVECFGDGSATLLVLADAAGTGDQPAQLLAELADRYREGEALPAGAVVCFGGSVEDGAAARELAGTAGADAVAWLRCCYDAVASNDAGASEELAADYRDAGSFGYFFDSRPGGAEVLEALALDGVPAIAVDMAGAAQDEVDRHVAGTRSALETLTAVE